MEGGCNGRCRGVRGLDFRRGGEGVYGELLLKIWAFYGTVW